MKRNKTGAGERKGPCEVKILSVQPEHGLGGAHGVGFPQPVDRKVRRRL